MLDASSLLGIAAAAGISLAATAALAVTTAHAENPAARAHGWPRGLGAAALLCAAAIGWIVAFGWHAPPPADRMHWPPSLALGGAVLLALAPLPFAFRTAAALGIAAGIVGGVGAWLILRGLGSHAAHAEWLAVGVGGVTAAVAWAWERASTASSPAVARIALGAGLGGFAAALLLAGSLAFGLRGAALAAAVGAPVLLAWWRLPRLGEAAGAAVGMAILGTLAWALAPLDRPSHALLPAVALAALAPLTPALTAIPGLRERRGLAAAVVLVLALLTAGGAAAWMQLRGQPVEAGTAEPDIYGY